MNWKKSFNLSFNYFSSRSLFSRSLSPLPQSGTLSFASLPDRLPLREPVGLRWSPATKEHLWRNHGQATGQAVNALPSSSKITWSKKTMQTSFEKPFFNQCFDKGRLKNFVLWFLLNYGEHKTVKLVEELKNVGFEYASKAGISLGVDDLKIPPKKAELIYDAEKQTLLTVNQYVRGEITGVERFQRLIDTWHRTSETLKQEVIDYFEATDILNPVYMMAFSGARGNISQVRQLVGMRGLMADPQGQIIDFPIRSNFREGLTVTEYIISSYGARKGIVDTALRTANAGYLTRRLVDVAQHVIISNFDCGTRRGIFLVNMKEGAKTIHSLSQRIVGRILARDLILPSQKTGSPVPTPEGYRVPSPQATSGQPARNFASPRSGSPSVSPTGSAYGEQPKVNEQVATEGVSRVPQSGKEQYKPSTVDSLFMSNVEDLLARRNDEVTLDLAFEIGKKFDKVFVRSPLTCETPNLICQLCYGWSLGQGTLVSIGEAVGVVAAQSIGEPGTQLTMRTFHTGGVFSGDISDQIRAPFNGVVEYLSAIPGTLIRTPEGKIAFLTKSEGVFIVLPFNSGETTLSPMSPETKAHLKRYKIPPFTLLYIRNGQSVFEKEVIAQISTISRKGNATDHAEYTIKADYEGQFYSKSLGFREKFIGPKIKMTPNMLDIYENKTDLAYQLMGLESNGMNTAQLTKGIQIEKVYEAWTWGYAWILSGKIYEATYKSSFFAQLGDLLNRHSSLLQTRWKLTDSQKVSYHIPKYTFNAFNSPESTKHQFGLVSSQNPVFKMDLSKILFKNQRYCFELENPSQFLSISSQESSNFDTHSLNTMSTSGRAVQKVNEKPSGYAMKKPMVHFSQDLVFFMRQLKSTTSNLEHDSNILLHLFPPTTQTLSGGYYFIENNSVSDNVTSFNSNSLKNEDSVLQIQSVLHFGDVRENALKTFLNVFDVTSDLAPMSHYRSQIQLENGKESAHKMTQHTQKKVTSNRILKVNTSFFQVSTPSMKLQSSLNSISMVNPNSLLIQTNRQGCLRPIQLNPTNDHMLLKFKTMTRSSEKTHEEKFKSVSFKTFKDTHNQTQNPQKPQKSYKVRQDQHSPRLRVEGLKNQTSKKQFFKLATFKTLEAFCQTFVFCQQTGVPTPTDPLVRGAEGTPKVNRLYTSSKLRGTEGAVHASGSAFKTTKHSNIKSANHSKNVMDTLYGMSQIFAPFDSSFILNNYSTKTIVNSNQKLNVAFGDTRAPLSPYLFASLPDRVAVSGQATGETAVATGQAVSGQEPHGFDFKDMLKNMSKKDFLDLFISNFVKKNHHFSIVSTQSHSLLNGLNKDKAYMNLFNKTQSNFEYKHHRLGTTKTLLLNVNLHSKLAPPSVFREADYAETKSKKMIGTVKKGWIVVVEKLMETQMVHYHKKLLYPGQKNDFSLSFPIPIFSECIFIQPSFNIHKMTRFGKLVQLEQTGPMNKSHENQHQNGPYLTATPSAVGEIAVPLRGSPEVNRRGHEGEEEQVAKEGKLHWVKNNKSRFNPFPAKSSFSETQPQLALMCQPMVEYNTLSKKELKQKTSEMASYSNKLRISNAFIQTPKKSHSNSDATFYSLFQETNCSTCTLNAVKKTQTFQKVDRDFASPRSGSYRSEGAVQELNEQVAKGKAKVLVNKSFDSLYHWKNYKQPGYNKQIRNAQILPKYLPSDFSVVMNPFFENLVKQYQFKNLTDPNGSTQHSVFRKKSQSHLFITFVSHFSFNVSSYLIKTPKMNDLAIHYHAYSVFYPYLSQFDYSLYPLLFQSMSNFVSFYLSKTIKNPNQNNETYESYVNQWQIRNPGLNSSYTEQGMNPTNTNTPNSFISNKFYQKLSVLIPFMFETPCFAYKIHERFNLRPLTENTAVPLRGQPSVFRSAEPLRETKGSMNSFKHLKNRYKSEKLRSKFDYSVNSELGSSSLKENSFARTNYYSPFTGEIVYTHYPTDFNSQKLSKNHSRLPESLNKMNAQGFPVKTLNYSCMFLTKKDLISYYLPSKNIQQLREQMTNESNKKRYVIRDTLVKFVNMSLDTSLRSSFGEVASPLVDRYFASPRSGSDRSVAGGEPQSGRAVQKLNEQAQMGFNLSGNQENPNIAGIKIAKLAAGAPYSTSSALLGDFCVYGDPISLTTAIPTSGQIIHYNNEKMTLRRGQPIFISPKGLLRKFDGDFIDPKSPVITLSYQRLKTGDIIQGIPKVEQFFEARTTKRGRLFRDNLPSLLKGLFNRYQTKLPLDLAVRQSFYKIQQIVVDGVQRVYKSQGVTIADKHLEVIVKQMTSKVRILDGAQTGFFAGEIVDLCFVEKINTFLIKKMTYEPLVLGITKASLEVDSFLSAASFQQTTRVLSKAAIYRKKDFLKGLKENVILGNLIPAGTGYLVYLDDR